MFRAGRDKGIATPVPLGLTALGVTTFLLGFGLIFQHPSAWGPYFTQGMMIGGLAEFVAGIWAFAYGDPLAATVFCFLGAFSGWWGVNGLLVHGAAMSPFSTAMVFIVGAVVVLYLWVASFYETAVFNLVLLFLWIAYGLMAISMFAASTVLAVIGGIAAIISSLLAAYGSFAELYNATGLQEVLPLGEPETVRKRSMVEEQERLRRIHMTTDHQDVQHA